MALTTFYGRHSTKPGVGAQHDWGHPRARRLVGHWLLNEGAGLSVRDLTQNHNSGTLVGGTTWIGGQRGAALTFDGSSGYVEVPNFSALIAASSEITLSGWVKNISGADKGGYGCRADSDGVGALYITILAPNAFEVRVNGTGGVVTFDSGAVLPVDVWSSIVAVYNGVTLVTYLNGLQIDSRAAALGTLNLTTVPLWIGKTDFSTANHRFGNYPHDDVRVYTRVLAAAEVLSLYTEPYADILLPTARRWSIPAAAGGAAVTYPQLERMNRGIERGILTGETR